MSKIIILVGILAAGLLLFYFVLVRRPQFQQVKPRPERTTLEWPKATVSGSKNSYLDTTVAKRSPSSTMSANPSYIVTQIDETLEHHPEAKPKNNDPYRISGRGSTARILDSRGNTLIQGNLKVGIYGCEISPNEKRLLVYYGDAEYNVIEPGTDMKVVLPPQPAGQNKLAFGSYHWMDDDALIAESGDQKLDVHGRPVQTDDNVSQTRLYVYSISTQTLEEAPLPQTLRTRVFSVTEVRPGGYVHLLADDASGGPTGDLGWFKVRAR
jgi:hypothetical protein